MQTTCRNSHFFPEPFGFSKLPLLRAQKEILFIDSGSLAMNFASLAMGINFHPRPKAARHLSRSLTRSPVPSSLFSASSTESHLLHHVSDGMADRQLLSAPSPITEAHKAVPSQYGVSCSKDCIGEASCSPEPREKNPQMMTFD